MTDAFTIELPEHESEYRPTHTEVSVRTWHFDETCGDWAGSYVNINIKTKFLRTGRSRSEGASLGLEDAKRLRDELSRRIEEIEAQR